MNEAQKYLLNNNLNDLVISKMCSPQIYVSDIMEEYSNLMNKELETELENEVQQKDINFDLLDVHNKIMSLVSNQFNIKLDDFSTQSLWYKDLGADSLDTVELLLELELSFDLLFTPDDRIDANDITIEDIIKLVKHKLNDNIN